MGNQPRVIAVRLASQYLDALIDDLACEAAYAFLLDGSVVSLATRSSREPPSPSRGAGAMPLSTAVWRPRLAQVRRDRVVACNPDDSLPTTTLVYGVTRQLVLAVVLGDAPSFPARSVLRAAGRAFRRDLINLIRKDGRRPQDTPDESSSGGSSWATVPPPPYHRVN